LTFKYNDKKEVMDVLDKNSDELAAVVMEPCRYYDPEDGFLELVRTETKKRGRLLIFDEITIAWRFHLGGAHMKYEVYPDIAVFGKTIGNGHPMGAVIGTKEAMQGAKDSFISSTFWTESTGPAAAIAAISIMERKNAPEYVEKIGISIMDIWKKYSKLHGLSIKTGHTFPCVAGFVLQYENALAVQTLFIQNMLQKGFLSSLTVYPTLAHNDDILAKYEQAIDETFMELSDAISKNEVEKRLKGPVKISSFARLI
jgi:glutamate-1-semialdehyde 2,1-aminomutase